MINVIASSHASESKKRNAIQTKKKKDGYKTNNKYFDKNKIITNERIEFFI